MFLKYCEIIHTIFEKSAFYIASKSHHLAWDNLTVFQNHQKVSFGFLLFPARYCSKCLIFVTKNGTIRNVILLIDLHINWRYVLYWRNYSLL